MAVRQTPVVSSHAALEFFCRHGSPSDREILLTMIIAVDELKSLRDTTEYSAVGFADRESTAASATQRTILLSQSLEPVFAALKSFGQRANFDQEVSDQARALAQRQKAELEKKSPELVSVGESLTRALKRK